jgi:AbrB family looped-hinge helix DNA binding protein
MASVTVSDKGQVVIPAAIRRRLGIVPGTRLEFTEEGAEIRVRVQRVRRETRIEDGYGMLSYTGSPHRLADFDVAAAMRRVRE